MIIVAYCRYSSENQRDGYSIEAQTRAITEWAKAAGHTIKRFYVDEARSATNDDRAEFQRMVADAASGTFQAVVVHKLDRFARDRYDSAVYKHKLKQFGVRVISVLEPLDDSPEAVMMEAVLEGMAEYFSKNLAREVSKGKKETALKAQHNGGSIPYGFTIDKDRHYIPIEEEAAVVREIFKRVDGGSTLVDVTRWAVAQGYRTRRNTAFNLSFIRSMLRSPIYIGTYSYGRRSTSGREPIVFENCIPAIVEPALFYRVNDMLSKRARGPKQRQKEEDYLLTGYLYCGICGAHLFGFKSKQKYKDKEYVAYWYRCSHRSSHRMEPGTERCKLKGVHKEEIETFVIESIKAKLFGEDSINWIVAELGKRIKARATAPTAAQLSAYQEELKKLSGQRERLLDLYLSGGLDKELYAKKSDELYSRIEFLTQEVAKLSVPSIEVSAERIRSALKAFNDSANADSVEYKKRLLSTFVDSVVLSNEEVIINYKVTIPGWSSSSDSFVRKANHALACFILRTKYPRWAIVAKDYSQGVPELVA